MSLARVFVFLLPIVAIHAISSYSGSCNCWPTKMGGKAYFNGELANTYYIDYDKNKVFEEWGNGEDVLYDMATMISYTFKNGGCRKDNVPHMKGYVRCVPDSATYQSQTTNGARISSFSYPESDYFLKRWVLEDNSCLPFEVKEWTMGGSTENVVLHANVVFTHLNVDDTVFDKDTSGCK